MADNSLNPSIIDSVTASNVSVSGEAPSVAIGSLYQTIGNSVAMAAANSVEAQYHGNVTFQTSNTIGVQKLLSK